MIISKIDESLIMPCSLSLCIFSAAAGVLLTDICLSLTCVLGFVSLMGVLVRNGIILFDYAHKLYNTEGLSMRFMQDPAKRLGNEVRMMSR